MKNHQIKTLLALPLIFLLLSCHSAKQTITSAQEQTYELKKQIDTIILRTTAIENETTWITRTDTAGRTTKETRITSRSKQAEASTEKNLTQTNKTITNQRDTTNVLSHYLHTPMKNTHRATLIVIATIITIILLLARFLKR